MTVIGRAIRRADRTSELIRLSQIAVCQQSILRMFRGSPIIAFSGCFVVDGDVRRR